MTDSKNLVHHLLIVDESKHPEIDRRQLIYQINQSLHAIRSEAIRNAHQSHKISLYLSSHLGIRCLYSLIDSLMAPLIHSEDIIDNAIHSQLYDAIGVGIASMRIAQHRAPSLARTQVTVFATQEDSCSQKYAACSLKTLINMLQSQGWLFTFVGLRPTMRQLAVEMGITMCCIVALKPLEPKPSAILQIMKRQWLLQQSENRQQKHGRQPQIDAA